MNITKMKFLDNTIENEQISYKYTYIPTINDYFTQRVKLSFIFFLQQIHINRN